jgi:two-component system cell cycle sensor histidine kinase/response regulator CckA
MSKKPSRSAGPDPGRPLEDADAARRASEESLRSFIDNAVFGIYRSATDGRVLMMNRTLATMLGYASPDELLGADLAATVYQDPAERARLVQRYRAGDRYSGVEAMWKRKDGKPVPVRLSGRVLHDDAGAVAAFEGIVEDLTERHALEQRLRQAEKMEAVGQLAGGMAHDFNNLLTTILTTADLIGGELIGDSTILNDLATIKAACRRGSELIRKLLAFARRQRLDIQPVMLDALLQETAMVLRRLLPPDIEMRLEVDETDNAVRADPVAVEQILVNLATNARDAMPGGGTLTISTAREDLSAAACAARGWGAPGRYAVLSVADTGIGMDPETQSHLFEPFFTTKPVDAGTGLGLAMVYGLVRQHDGFLDVRSTPGSGTTVRVLLPAAESAARPSAPEGDTTQLRGTETILLAEDEDALRRAATRVLEKHGYRVLEAANGAEALELFGKHELEIALIVADVVMPTLGGPQLLRELRQAGKTVRVLFTSGYTARDVQETTALDPSLPFLAKPWTITDLLRRVREVLDQPAPG